MKSRIKRKKRKEKYVNETKHHEATKNKKTEAKTPKKKQ